MIYKLTRFKLIIPRLSSQFTAACTKVARKSRNGNARDVGLYLTFQFSQLYLLTLCISVLREVSHTNADLAGLGALTDWMMTESGLKWKLPNSGQSEQFAVLTHL